MTERSTSQMMGATLLGGLVGAGVALLFAPRSGKETRKRIHNKMDAAREGTQDKLDHAKGKLREGISNARDLKNRLTEAAKKTGDSAESEIEELKKSRKHQSPVLSAWEEEV